MGVKYKNNTSNIITYTSKFSQLPISLIPGEEKEFNFYIDPSRTEFTLISDDGAVDPIMYNASVSITANTDTIVDIPVPKLSQYYRLTITIGGVDVSLKFNKSTNNAVTITASTYYANMFIWEYVPRLILRAASNTTVTVSIEEIYGMVYVS